MVSILPKYRRLAWRYGVISRTLTHRRKELTMKIMMTFLAFVLLTGCAPLNPNNTPMQDVGEVALRTVLFPLSFGLSEMHLGMKHLQEKERQQYQQWYGNLSPDQQDREDRRNAARMNAAAMMMMGSQRVMTVPQYQPNPNLNPIVTTPVPTYQPRQMPRSLNCTSAVNGNYVNTNCY